LITFGTDLRTTNHLSQSSQHRNVVPVAHAAYAELHFLRRLGVDIEEIPGILAVLDTQKIAKEVFRKNLSLRDLLEALWLSVPKSAWCW
jgi:hypothetical protein